MLIRDDRGRQFDAPRHRDRSRGYSNPIVSFVVVFCTLFAPILMGLIGFSLLGRSADSGVGTRMLLGAAALGIIGFFAIPWLRRQSRAQVVGEDELRTALLCVVCGQSLADAPTDAGGFRVCPSCGASWGIKACERCGYPLTGVVQKEDGRLTCPDCGTVRAGAN